MNLAQKRKQAYLVILGTVFGSALVAAAPKHNLELAKQVFLTVADVVMCMIIWDTYFQENLYQKNIKSIFLELFFVILVSVITAYVTSKGIAALSDRSIASLGVIGWGVTGAIAALAASLLGFAWAFYCDDLYRN